MASRRRGRARTIREPSTYANLDDAVVSHVHLDARVDFEESVMYATVELTFTVLRDGVRYVALDTRGLDIDTVRRVGGGKGVDGKEQQFTMPFAHEAFGQALRITLDPPAGTEKGLTLRIRYSTTPSSSAMQFLQPQQTSGKQHPFLFTQCEAIHARSMLPCQDSPAVKQTYTARIRVPNPLTALMSARIVDNLDGEEHVPKVKAHKDDTSSVFMFKQPVPIASYLIALTVGRMESRKIGPRSHVWAEPEVVEAAAYEFADTENYVAAGEKLLGDYVWGNYDLIVLPPSFPYGGMENPQVTNVTPTLLAGDRSLANVVAHEIAHSWTGNLVTSRTWENFWLNEGFTVFVERKIIAAIHGDKHFGLGAVLGWQALKESVDHFGEDSPLTALVPELDGMDPDDAFSSVPYEKGFAFLCYLQEFVGGAEKFEPWLKAYIDKFKFKTVVTDEFQKFFIEYFEERGMKDLDNAIDWHEWLKEPGMAPVKPKVDTSLSDESEQLAQRWIVHANSSSKDGDDDDAAAAVAAAAAANFKKDDQKEWSAKQVMVFLDVLMNASNALPRYVLYAIDQLYRFTASRNSEIRFRWYMVCIRAEYSQLYDEVVAFLGAVGRMKFVRPLYRQLAKVPSGRIVAVRTFAKFKDNYHPIAAKMIAKDLSHLDEDGAISAEQARVETLALRLDAVQRREDAITDRRNALKLRERALAQRTASIAERERVLAEQEAELRAIVASRTSK